MFHSNLSCKKLLCSPWFFWQLCKYWRIVCSVLAVLMTIEQSCASSMLWSEIVDSDKSREGSWETQKKCKNYGIDIILWDGEYCMIGIITVTPHDSFLPLHALPKLCKRQRREWWCIAHWGNCPRCATLCIYTSTDGECVQRCHKEPRIHVHKQCITCNSSMPA